MAIARGQITIVDLNDAKSLNLYLSSNHPTTQIFNKENTTYVPNYATNNLVLSPELFVSGTSTNVIANIKGVPTWKINGTVIADTNGFGAVIGKTAPYALTLKNNLTNTTQLAITCDVIYVDPKTRVETPCKASITITKTENAGQLIVAVATTPKGSIFKQGGEASLIAKCELWRGSQVDNTNVEYKWSRLKNGVFEVITATNAEGCTGFNTSEMTVPNSAVLNFATFKCEIKDTDQSSGTYNTTVSDVVSFADLTDPYQIEVVSTTGDKLVNGQGSTTLTAEVWQAGEKLTDVSRFNFLWKRYDKNGGAVASWSANTQSVTITSAQVDVKSTFVVELSLK